MSLVENVKLYVWLMVMASIVFPLFGALLKRLRNLDMVQEEVLREFRKDDEQSETLRRWGVPWRGIRSFSKTSMSSCDPFDVVVPWDLSREISHFHPRSLSSLSVSLPSQSQMSQTSPTVLLSDLLHWAPALRNCETRRQRVIHS